MDQEQKKNSGLIITIVVIAVVALIGLGALAFNGKSTTPVATTTTDTTSSSANTTDTSSTTSSTTSTSPYKDGTYTAEGSYISPGGTEAVNVTLTLKNGLVTDATVVSEAKDPESTHYQTKFISGFKQYVIGKDISTLSLSKVSGSSLTSGGFNKAVASIKTQAQA